MQLFWVILLGFFVFHDLKNRAIPAIWIWICMGWMLIYRLSMLYSGKSSVTELFLCTLPGMGLLLLSYWGKQIGSGDGWLIITGGLCLGWEMLMEALTYAFLTAGLFGAGCLFLTHKRKDTRIPFIPFLFIGVIIPMVRNIL